MADAMEKAAQVFDAAIKAESNGKGPNPPPAPAARARAPKVDNEGPEERLFGNSDGPEVDDESPAQGGGDDEDLEAGIYEDDDTPPKRRKKDDDDEEGDDNDEPDAGDDDTADEDEDPDEAAFLAQEVKVVVDGEERTVKVKEALEGYVRTETFHKRMNEVDEIKKIAHRVAADAVQNYQYTMQIGKEMEEHLKALVPQEPNWDEEFQKNPARARELQKYYEQVNGFRSQLRVKMDEATKKQMESDRVQVAAFAEAESKKFDSANSKHWATDPKKKAKDLQAMRRTALSSGFSEEEISQVYDSRMLTVLLKASKYDRMMASKPKPVIKGRGKPVVPGTGSARARTVQKGYSSAMKRLNKTGSLDDAAVVMDELWQRGG